MPEKMWNEYCRDEGVSVALSARRVVDSAEKTDPRDKMVQNGEHSYGKEKRQITIKKYLIVQNSYCKLSKGGLHIR